MGFGSILKSGFNAFRSGGFRRGLKFARGAGRRGLSNFKKFRKKKFNSFSPRIRKISFVDVTGFVGELERLVGSVSELSIPGEGDLTKSDLVLDRLDGLNVDKLVLEDSN